MYEENPIYASKKRCVEKHVDLLLIEEKGKRHFDKVLIYSSKKNIFVFIVYKSVLQTKY